MKNILGVFGPHSTDFVQIRSSESETKAGTQRQLKNKVLSSKHNYIYWNKIIPKTVNLLLVISRIYAQEKMVS